MSLAETSLPVGPFNVPVWLLGALTGLIVVTVLERTVWRSRRDEWRDANDVLLTALLLGIVGWKLTPLVTRFAEIAQQPTRLIYYAGGTAGAIAGAILALGSIAVRMIRRRTRIAVLFYLLPLAVVGVGILVPTLVPSSGASERSVEGVESLAGGTIPVGPGEPVVIVAWATWCGPCSAQMPEVARFHREHPAVRLIALDLTATEASVDAVRSYVADHGLDLPVGLDRSGAWARRLEVTSTPTLILLDVDGTERLRHVGAVNYDWLVRRVLPFGR